MTLTVHNKPDTGDVTQYRVTFERIGRNRNVEPLTVDVDGPNHLAEAIYRYARPHLLSRDVEVTVNLAAGKGWIFCGFNNGGDFTIDRVVATTGPFKIVVTMVRVDTTTVADTEAPAWYRGEVARDEQQQPEQVVTTIALHETCDQASALRHAQAITDTIPAADRAAYRVKVVPA